MGNAVGDVAELAGIDLVEFRHGVLSQQFGVQGGYAVDLAAGYDAEVGHADLLVRAFLDKRNLAQEIAVAREVEFHLLEESVVDLENDLGVTRQYALHQIDRPFLEGFGEQGVVGVAEGIDGDVPRLFPRDSLFVVQDAHELDHRQRWVGVVELDGILFGKPVEGGMGFPVAADNVAHGAGGEEIFLDQAQLLAGIGVVGWIQHLGDVFRPVLFLHGPHIVPLVENIETETFGRLRFPQA